MTMGDFKPRMLLVSVLVVANLLPVHETVKKDNCEYDMDLTRNIIKVTCDGSASSVNVYADTAHVSSDDIDEDKDDEGNGVNENNQVRPKTKESQSPSDNQEKSKQPNANGKRRSNKELRSNGTDQRSGRMSADHGNDRKWDFSKFESPFSDVVWNATQKLDDARRKLTNYAGSLRNITNQLAEGDLHLRSDMDNLRRTSNTATELKEGIIAAMRNQYNFMRSALLTHNYELVRVMNSLDVLVDVTSDGFHSALMAHKTSLEQIHHLNTTLTAVRKMVSTELRRRLKRVRGFRKGHNYKECPKEISAIGSGYSRKVDIKEGSYMVESYTPNVVSSVWIMKGSETSDQLIEYDTAVDIDYNLIGRYYALPFFCQGTGHAVFRRHFYCHEKGTNTVYKYQLKNMDIVSEVVLPGTHLSRYPYRSGHNVGVDLAVDELGLWAIYATEESGGKLVISKINHQKMEVEKTWVTKYFKVDVGNAFMICGVLYATDSHADAPTFIRYTYNTETSTDNLLESGQLPFANSANLLSTKKKHRAHHLADSSMLSYDFRSSVLYSWSNSKVESFPVYFTKQVP